MGGLAPRASQKGTFFGDKDHCSNWQTNNKNLILFLWYLSLDLGQIYTKLQVIWILILVQEKRLDYGLFLVIFMRHFCFDWAIIPIISV